MQIADGHASVMERSEADRSFLHVVVELGLLFGRDAAILRPFDQLYHSLLDAIGRMERDDCLGCSTSGDEIDDFFV